MSTNHLNFRNVPSVKTGAAVLTALLLALMLYGCTPGTAKNGNGTSAASPAPSKAPTIPPNAPAGAQPPNEAGSPNATVKLEEFADFQCGSCAAASPTMNEIKSMYGTRIHFIFRNFPLQIPAHDKSFDAAVAAEAAGSQGKFWEMHHQLFSHQQEWTKAPNFREIWKGYAQTIGLNVPKWETDINGIEAKGRVNADMDRGKALNINSTPTLYINGTSVQFQDMNVDGLKKIIDAELQKASPQSAQPANSEAKPPANATTK
jgi:protein-disulfide isomerase